jgi:hypothetical protein
MMSLSRKHSQGVVKDVASALNTLVQPRGAMALLVNRNRKGLASAVIHGIVDCNIEFFWVLRQMVRARHAYLPDQFSTPYADTTNKHTRSSRTNN